MIIVYDDTELPAGPFPCVLNGSDQAVVLHIEDGADHGENGDINEDGEWDGETITFENRAIFDRWARRVAELAGLAPGGVPATGQPEEEE